MESNSDGRLFFLENTLVLRQKVHYLGTISSDDLFFFFFLEITAFLGQKVDYLRTISSNYFFVRDHLESRTKIGLEHHDIRTKN